MADIETLFPPDPEMTEEEINNALDRPHYAARIVAGGAVAVSASVAAFRVWRHFHPYVGIDDQE